MVNGEVWNKDPEVRCWGYKPGGDSKKEHLNMSFNSQFPITDNSSTSNIMDVDLIVMKAQEQLHLEMEAQHWKNSLWHWEDKMVEAWIMELDLIVVSDKGVAGKELER